MLTDAYSVKYLKISCFLLLFESKHNFGANFLAINTNKMQVMMPYLSDCMVCLLFYKENS